jgi:hypothetical protein
MDDRSGPQDPLEFTPKAAPAGDDGQTMAEQAARCRRLAGAIYNRDVSDMLTSMADGFARSAAGARADNDR